MVVVRAAAARWLPLHAYSFPLVSLPPPLSLFRRVYLLRLLPLLQQLPLP